jgi:antitoxin component YwqK of YwqJK toxin-antitoxin module
MDNISSRQKFLSVLLARASKITGSSNLDSKLYRKVGLLEAKLLAIKSQDILEDLTDIEYLNKLEAKSKKLVKDLAQKKIIPLTPKGLLDSDFNTLKKLITFFETEDWKMGKRKLETVSNFLFSSPDPLKKSDLDNFLKITSKFQDTLKEKCQKFEDLNKSDFWIDGTLIEPLLNEYSILQNGEPLSNPQIGSELHEILVGVNKFEANWLKKLDDFNNKTNEFLEKWHNVKSNESKLDSILKNGQIEEVQSALVESARFTDLNLKIRDKVKLYEDIKKEGVQLVQDSEKFIKDSLNDKIWASKNTVLSKKISQSLKTIQNWISKLDTHTANGLKLESDLVEWKDLAEETKAEVSKSIKIADDLAKAKKRKKNISILLVLAATAGLFYFFGKDHREKQRKLQNEANAFGVDIHVLESALSLNNVIYENKPPSDFTGWRLLRDNKGFGYNLSYYQKGIRDGFYCELYSSSQIKEKGKYLNGKKHGRWVSWWADGKIKSDGNYSFGEQDGIWLYFASDGTRGEKFHKTKADILAERIAEAKRNDEARQRQIEEEHSMELAEIAEHQRAAEEEESLQREKNTSEHISSSGIITVECSIHPYGPYVQELLRSIGENWHYLARGSLQFLHSDKMKSKITYRFTLQANGNISDLEFLGSGNRSLAAELCRQAIFSRVPFGKWTQEMIDDFGQTDEIIIHFNYR